MKSLFNQLIQLQELYFAREEHRISGQENRSDELDKSIKSLLRKLPADTASYFQKLQERDPPAMAPVVGQTCYGCGIELPTSLLSEMLRLDSIYQCPNCTRFLYLYPEGKLTLRHDSLHHKLPRLGIEKFSSEELMLPRLRSEDKEGVITELAELICEQLSFPHPKLMVEKAMKREAIMSTAVEHSLAFPHVRGIDAGSLTLALGIKKNGIKFGAARNRLTRIFFFLVIPPAASAFYLKLLAALIEALQSAETRKTLIDSTTAPELWKALKKLTKKHLA